MDSDQLRAFLAVAERGQLTTAARLLGRSQSTLSRQLQALERLLGTRLLTRTPRGVVLSDAGERFLPHARGALDALQAGAAELDELAQKPRGWVALGTLPTVGAYLMPGLLAAYQKRFPLVQIRLTEALGENLEERVALGELDLAILNLPLRRLDLVAQKLWQEDFVLLVPRGHRLGQTRRPLALTDVAGEPLVVVPNTAATEALRAACAERGQAPRVTVEAENPESVRRLVERGLGLALLPRLMVRERNARGFEVVEVGRGGLRRQVALVHRGERALSAAARALKRMLGEHLRQG